MRFWLAVATAFAALSVAFTMLGLPSPFLFAGVIAGAVGALSISGSHSFPERLRRLGLAVIGCAAGSSIDPGVLETVAGRPGLVAAGVVGTLVASLIIGQLLRLSSIVDAPTAMLASIAGGASGVSAMARELDADEGIVLSVQYLRVVVILASLPVVAGLLGAPPAAGNMLPSNDTHELWGYVYTVAAVGSGLFLAHFLRFTASPLLLTMVIATALSLAGVFPSAEVPRPVLDGGYAVIGLMVGVAFSRATVRQLAKIMPLALLQTVLNVAVCGAAGILFAKAAGISLLEGYLATTPGGLPAVAAIAIGTGSGVGLIMAMQVVRVFTALLLASAVAALLRRRSKGPDAD